MPVFPNIEGWVMRLKRCLLDALDRDDSRVAGSFNRSFKRAPCLETTRKLCNRIFRRVSHTHDPWRSPSIQYA